MLHNSVELVVAMVEDSAHVRMLEESTCSMDTQAHCLSSICVEWFLAKWRLSAHQAESSSLRSLYYGESSGRDGWASTDVLLATHSKSDADDCKAGLLEVDEHRILTQQKGKAQGVVAENLARALSEIVVVHCFAVGRLYRKRPACHEDREELENQVVARLPGGELVEIL